VRGAVAPLGPRREAKFEESFGKAVSEPEPLENRIFYDFMILAPWGYSE